MTTYERTLKPNERIQYKCEHWYEAGSYGVRLNRDLTTELCQRCERDYKDRAIAQYEPLKALNEQLVEALERARPSSPVGTVRSAIDRALAAAKEME